MATVNTSLVLYRYLCQHVVGTEEIVKTKRMLNGVRDNTYQGRNSVTTITSGSFGEGLEMKGSDFDIMYVGKKITVLESMKALNFNSTKTYFVIDTEDTKPGFVKLRLIFSNNKILVGRCIKVGSSFYLSNLLYKLFFRTDCTLTIHGPCLTDKNGNFDFAYCLHSSSWISSANQWLKRPHRSWPTTEVKLDIVDHGTLFVPIGAKGSRNEELEWRISFSVGEKLLMYSFNHTQLSCYTLMKILLKVLISREKRCKELLCSYYLKTIMFWVSEELSLTEWKPECLIRCFLICFRRLIYCVKYSLCPHYFIPEINMFENKIEGFERQLLLKNLYILHRYGWRCLLISDELAKIRLTNDITSSQSFSDYVEHMLRSNSVYFSSFSETNYVKAIKTALSYASRRIKLLCVFHVSVACNLESQKINIKGIYGNKQTYRKYTACICWLLQNINHDAVSGWLMLASFFYRMERYHTVLEILLYSLSKCTPEKVQTVPDLSYPQCTLLTTKTWQKVGLMRILKILCLQEVNFDLNSSLIPAELESEVAGYFCLIPPVVFAHFLCFLCHYHLNNSIQCRNSLRDLKLTITENYFISCYSAKTVASNCLRIAQNLYRMTATQPD